MNFTINPAAPPATLCRAARRIYESEAEPQWAAAALLPFPAGSSVVRTMSAGALAPVGPGQMAVSLEFPGCASVDASLTPQLFCELGALGGEYMVKVCGGGPFTRDAVVKTLHDLTAKGLDDPNTASMAVTLAVVMAMGDGYGHELSRGQANYCSLVGTVHPDSGPDIDVKVGQLIVQENVEQPFTRH